MKMLKFNPKEEGCPMITKCKETHEYIGGDACFNPNWFRNCHPYVQFQLKQLKENESKELHGK